MSTHFESCWANIAIWFPGWGRSPIRLRRGNNAPGNTFSAPEPPNVWMVATRFVAEPEPVPRAKRDGMAISIGVLHRQVQRSATCGCALSRSFGPATVFKLWDNPVFVCNTGQCSIYFVVAGSSLKTLSSVKESDRRHRRQLLSLRDGSRVYRRGEITQ